MIVVCGEALIDKVDNGDGTERAAPRVVDTVGAGVLAWLHNREALRPDLRLDAEQLESLLAFACSVASLTYARAGAEPPRRFELGQGA